MISCLTITQEGRLAEVKQSLRCFARQTFAQREMVIIHDGSDSYSAEIEAVIQAGKAQFPNLDTVVHRADKGQFLGSLRNLSMRIAKYPTICQWDDDDWYHPRRLEVQYDHLQSGQGDFCFLTDQLHYFQAADEFFWDDWNVETYPMNLIQGTMMGARDKVPTYPSITGGEDTTVLKEMHKSGLNLINIDGHGYLYVYVFNGNNYFDYEHHTAISNWKRLRKKRLLERETLLKQAIVEYEWPGNKWVFPHDTGNLVIEA